MPVPERAAWVLAGSGWDEGLARDVVAYVCARLAQAGSRATAFEMLRRDAQARVLLGLSSASWAGVLRAVLGHPETHRSHGRAGRGILLRLVLGETPGSLLADEDLVLGLGLARPGGGSGR